MFRTPTGQTGLDAYKFEAAAIANAQRELDARFEKLLDVIHEEAPEMIRQSTDYRFTGARGAKSFCEYLKGHDHYIQWIKKGGHIR